MPFDNRRLVLTETAAMVGLKPIPMETLQAYKKKQLRKHPGSWAYHHDHAMAKILAFGALIVWAAATCIALALSLYLTRGLPDAACIFISFGVTGAVVVGGGFAFCGFMDWASTSIQFKGPASWQEARMSFHYLPSDVPERIRETARKLHEELGTGRVQFTVGTLYQHTKILDPYLVAQCDMERICLGIWDGEKIIACA